ncbi:MAG: tetratricopeptide repeat protein [Bacteroidales bacterium]|nr:tetratricopeptide repeat protein [Bacteroidales bacterium]
MMRKATLFIVSFMVLYVMGAYGQSPTLDELIQEGVELHDGGEYEEAIDRYLEALEMDSTSILAIYELSLSYLALKDFDNALEYSTQVIDSEHEQLSTGAYAVKSEALAELERVNEAIEVLQKGLDIHGDEYLLHFNMALNYYKKGNTDKTMEHVKRAIDVDKTHSGAFLLYAYALNDKGLWVQSILSFQMFLLLEPDSRRSKNAFEELLQTMQLKKPTEPVERSFIQQQMMRNKPETSAVHPDEVPPLSIEGGLNRNFVYHAITSTLDSLKSSSDEIEDFVLFKTVNKAIIEVLERESLRSEEGVFWTFYVPFFSRIAASDYFDTFCRYISVSYYPESLEWWQQNPEAAVNFIIWFEKGDDS